MGGGLCQQSPMMIQGRVHALEAIPRMNCPAGILCMDETLQQPGIAMPWGP